MVCVRHTIASIFNHEHVLDDLSLGTNQLFNLRHEVSLKGPPRKPVFFVFAGSPPLSSLGIPRVPYLEQLGPMHNTEAQPKRRSCILR